MIRDYRTEDFEEVTRLWFDAMQFAMPALQARMGHTLEDARAFFLKVIVVENKLWVYETGGVPVGFLAMQKDFIDRLYVDPAWHRRGIGSALLAQARIRSSRHLWLYTHVANLGARNFYEKNDFIAERYGQSPAPESEPDVEYHWRPR